MTLIARNHWMRYNLLTSKKLLRCRHSQTFSSSTKGGAGIGNVQDKMLASKSHLSDHKEPKQLYQHIPRPKTASIIGAPMTFGQPYVGTDHGPKLLRDQHLLQHLSSLGWRVRDLADLDFDSIVKNYSNQTSVDHKKAKNSKIVGEATFMLSQVVEQQIKKGRFPVVLGGDHSIAIGTLAGALRARPNLGVIWVDAHADLQTPDTTETGNMHGMPVGLLMEGLINDYNSIPGLEWLSPSSSGDTIQPLLSPDSIVYVGLRDVDAAEREVIHEKNIKAFTMHDVDHYGIGNVMDMALAHLLEKAPDRPIHLSYDIDAVDPLLAPATGTAVRGGLTYREAHFVAEAVAKSGNLTSVEMVELNPTLSDEHGIHETVELGLGLLTSLMGKSII